MNNEQYANRFLEHHLCLKALSEDTSIILIEAYQACGITSFLKNCLMCDPFFKNKTPIYCNAASYGSLAEAILVNLVRSPYKDELQNYVNKNLGSKDISLFSAFVKGIPYVGELISWAGTKKTAAPIYTGDYASIIEEIIIPFLRDIKYKNKTVVIIDAAQNLDEESYELIRSLTSSNIVKCLLAFTEQSPFAMKLLNHIKKYSLRYTPISFDRPFDSLVIEIGSLYGQKLSVEDADEIVRQTKQNIHEIINRILERVHGQKDEPFSSSEKAVISILKIIKTPIKIEEVLSIASKCGLYAPNISEQINKTVRSLKQRRIILQDYDSICLAVYHHPIINNELSSHADQLFYTNVVYDYLKSQGNEKNVELQYYLSKELCYSDSDIAKAFMHELIISGKPIASGVFHDARLNKKNRYDCMLAGIALCRSRRYEDALEWIESIPKTDVDIDVLSFMAMLYNRTRELGKAKKLLKKCIKMHESPSMKNLLTAYLVTNYIHSEDLKSARKTYVDAIDTNINSSQQGYLIRNAASAYTENRIEIYNKALNCFKDNSDDFGYYSTLCNKGYAYFLDGCYPEALLLLQESASGLEVFSCVHLHIVYNNLGICYMLSNQFEEARKYLNLSKSFSNNSMPRIFSIVNLACLEAITGNMDIAIDYVLSIENEVENHPLDRVRQKYYINRLLIEYLRENRDIKSLITRATCYPDRYLSSEHKRHIELYSSYADSQETSYVNNWKDLFSPCGLVYWYIDPLKLLSEVALDNPISIHT